MIYKFIFIDNIYTPHENESIINTCKGENAKDLHQIQFHIW